MPTAVSPRTLGSTYRQVHPIALGCMGMSGMYGPSSEDESVATIREFDDHPVATWGHVSPTCDAWPEAAEVARNMGVSRCITPARASSPAA